MHAPIEAGDDSYLSVSKVQSNGVNLDQDLSLTRLWHGSSGLAQLVETILGSKPLLDFSWERHGNSLITNSTKNVSKHRNNYRKMQRIWPQILKTRTEVPAYQAEDVQ
jgi:hypothetical protein